MTTISARVDSVLEESRKIEFRETVLKAVAYIFFSIGWLIGKFFALFKFLWRSVTFMWVAAAVGFRSVNPKKGG